MLQSGTLSVLFQPCIIVQAFETQTVLTPVPISNFFFRVVGQNYIYTVAEANVVGFALKNGVAFGAL